MEFLLLQWGPTYRLYWSVAPHLYQRSITTDIQQYDLSIDPLRIHWIDPHKIERFSDRSSRYLRRDVGAVIDGSWDENVSVNQYGHFEAERVSDTILYDAMVQRYKNRVEWEDTEFVAKLIEIASPRNPVWHNCRSEEEIMERCSKVDRLFEAISNEGYKTQFDLSGVRPKVDEWFGYLHRLLNEISIDIGRDGEPLYLNSKHRLIIAKILDLEEVPVVVIARHKGWVENHLVDGTLEFQQG